MKDRESYSRFRDFYPYYLSEHKNGHCRLMHFIGTSLVMFIACISIWIQEVRLLLFLPLVGYGFAWIGHFVFEKNKPATFQHPLYSLMGDFVMYFDILRGKLPMFAPPPPKDS